LIALLENAESPGQMPHDISQAVGQVERQDREPWGGSRWHGDLLRPAAVAGWRSPAQHL